MRIAYRPLFEVRFRHAYYASGEIREDFSVVPSPATRRVMTETALLFKPAPDGFGIYAETVPDTDPPKLLRSLVAEGRPLAFLLHTLNARLVNISALPAFRPGQQLFYFNNLRFDQTGGRLHLGDSVADARVGEAITLVSGDVLTYPFSPALESAKLTIKDIFGETIDQRLVRTPEPGTPISEYRFELSKVAGMGAGRYAISDDHGGSKQIYYDRALSQQRPFAVIEIFDSTTLRTPDQSEQVPTEYRFVDGDELTGLAPYHIQIEGRATTWRYNVIKKYTSNNVTLAGLTITGDLDFSKVVETDRAVFTSDASITLSESVRSLSLMQGEEKVRDLPNPGLKTPLQQGANAGSFVSDLFVNV